jgi:histo-blood group ABO system transferase
MNPFNYIIITRTFNAENYIKLAIDSVKKQTIFNWKCIIVNDLSTDRTKEIIEENIKDNSKFTLLTNPEHSGSALESFINGVNLAKPNDEDVLVVLDGDDYLENNCLEVLEKYYNNTTVLLTYGSYKYTHINIAGMETRQGYNIGDNIRKLDWRASHCRTFKYKLFKACPVENFKDANNKYIGPTEDLAMMFPLIELAGIQNTRHVKELIYNYNDVNPLSDCRVKTVEQNTNATMIRNRSPLQQISFPIPPKKLNIALVTIATNKYIEFIEPLYKSVKEFFLTNHNVDMFCFTDKNTPEGIIRIEQKHIPFPYPTLLRYHIFMKQYDLLKKYDAVYYCDADMIFVDKVGNEVLSDLTATLHPGFIDDTIAFYSYQRNPISVAFIPLDQGEHYYCGGFNGGFRYLDMCRELEKLIDLDLKRNICAIHHDESYLNRFLLDIKPTCILSPEYCYPDVANIFLTEKLAQHNYKPKIIALEKDHKKFRS